MESNAQGPSTLEGSGEHFYVKPNCCLLCGVPESIAPELFETGENECTVKRQPMTDIELGKAIRAMQSSEVDCIRYSGRNEAILRRLGQAGMAALADDPRAASTTPLERDCVTFTWPHGFRGHGTPAKIAREFRRDMRHGGNTVLPAFLKRNTVQVSWYERNFHAVTFERTNDKRTFAAVLSSGNVLIGIAWLVDDWLKSKGAMNITWQVNGRSDQADELSTPI